jgi:SAM-dependent methyltransferase
LSRLVAERPSDARRGAPPDVHASRRIYRRWAPLYDRLWDSGLAEAARRRPIGRLGLRPGASVLDAGCGTGGSFDLLEQRIGPEGRIVGLDSSPEMLARARRRVEDHGWSNVELVEADASEADLRGPFDAFLFSFVHDVTRSPAALDRVLAPAAAGARVVAAGVKWAPRPALPLNFAVWLLARSGVTTFEGFDRPWSLLAPRLRDVRVESAALGTLYYLSGTVDGTARAER